MQQTAQGGQYTWTMTLGDISTPVFFPLSPRPMRPMRTSLRLAIPSAAANFTLNIDVAAQPEGGKQLNLEVGQMATFQQTITAQTPGTLANFNYVNPFNKWSSFVFTTVDFADAGHGGLDHGHVDGVLPATSIRSAMPKAALASNLYKVV